jgi:hypothetical protein
MKAEIAARGPIACLMYGHAASFESYAGGVIDDETRYKGITHVVTVTGWGVTTSGAAHWIVRNSFGPRAEGRRRERHAHVLRRRAVDAKLQTSRDGRCAGTQWGELGYYRQAMGKDVYNMESHACSWATPTTASVAALVRRSGM